MKLFIIFTAVMFCSLFALGQGEKYTTDEGRTGEVRVSVWALFEYNSGGSDEGEYPDGAISLLRCYPHDATDEEIEADFFAFIAQLYPDGIGPPLRGPYITRSFSSINSSIEIERLYFTNLGDLPNNIRARPWISNWSPNGGWSGRWYSEANLQSLVIGRNTRSLELFAPSIGCPRESVVVHLHSLPLPDTIHALAKSCGYLDSITIPFTAPLENNDVISRVYIPKEEVGDIIDLDFDMGASEIRGSDVNHNRTLPLQISGGKFFENRNYKVQIRWTSAHMGNNPSIEEITLNIQHALPLSVRATDTIHPTCPGDSNGSITVSFSGGRPFGEPLIANAEKGYDIVVKKGDSIIQNISHRVFTPWQVSTEYFYTIPNLLAGIYTIIVMDRDSATDTITVELRDPVIPMDSIFVDYLPLIHFPDGTQNVAPGRLVVKPSSSTRSYSWNDGQSSPSNTELFPTTAGRYILRVTYNSGLCHRYDTVYIGIGTLDIPQVQVERQPFCQTSPTGILHATQPQKDTLENSFFSWHKDGDLLDRGDTLYGILPGDYTLCINYRGVKSCASITSLSALDNITLQEDSIVHLLCYGIATGRIALIVEGGTGYYIWNDIEFSSNTKEWTDLLAGEHTITIKDQADPVNCMSEITITLTQPDRITIRDSIEHIDCFGDLTGKVFFTVSGGTGSYTWASGHSGNLTPTSDSTFIFTGLPEDSHVFTIIDGECSKDISVDVIFLSSPYLAIHDLVHHTILCVGQYHRPNPSPDTLRYVWTSISEPGLVFHERTPRLYSGIYMVRAFDEFNCFAADTITIIAAPDTVVAEFWLNSDVFINEITTIVHVSYPVPDSALWVVPDNVEILSYSFEFIELIFHEQGVHAIGLIAYKGACIDYTETKILVNSERQGELLPTSPALFDYAFVSPNPSTDYFELRLRTRRNATLLIQLFPANTIHQPVRTIRRNASAYRTLTETVSVQNLPAGTYILTIQSDTDRKVIRIVVI
ncbi:MAG: hypothetical protein FWD02_04200 [Bacteroidales bacterium]|nr:hypothetical protein [Bacteroidales bacterium]